MTTLENLKENLSKNIKNNQSCIHTRQLASMVDVDRNDLRFSFFKRHTKSCQVCQNKLKEIEKSLLRLDFYIPKPIPNTDVKNEFQTEINSLFDNLNLSIKAQKKHKKINFFKKISEIMADVEVVLSDKKFIFLTALIIGTVVAFNLWSK